MGPNERVAARLLTDRSRIHGLVPKIGNNPARDPIKNIFGLGRVNARQAAYWLCPDRAFQSTEAFEPLYELAVLAVVADIIDRSALNIHEALVVGTYEFEAISEWVFCGADGNLGPCPSSRILVP